MKKQISKEELIVKLEEDTEVRLTKDEEFAEHVLGYVESECGLESSVSNFPEKEAIKIGIKRIKKLQRIFNKKNISLVYPLKKKKASKNDKSLITLPSDEETSIMKQWKLRGSFLAYEVDKYSAKYRKKLLGRNKVLNEGEAANWLRSQGYQDVVKERIKTKIKLKQLRKKHGPSYLKELISEERSLKVDIADISTIPIPSEGPLERLWAYTSFLQGLTGWIEEEAVKFILLGKAPSYVAIRGSIPWPSTEQRHFITLKIDPRVTPKELVSFYKLSLEEFFNLIKEYRKGEIAIPKRSRPLDLNTLNLIKFVLSTPEMSWEERAILWNEKPHSKRYSNPHAMESVFSRAKKRLNSLFA